MSRPVNPATLDYAIELYLAGEPVEQIPSKAGVSLTRLHRERIARGIPTRFHRDLPTAEIARAYESGASEYALARQYGVGRAIIGKQLALAGLQRRGLGEAQSTRAAQMTPEQRKAQVTEANRAARRRRIPEIEKFRRALTVERQGRPGSDGEVRLHEMLRERGEQPAIERAIGPYNVDLAMLPVAVEVLGGGFHGVKARHAERTPYILDAGWHLVMVWNYEGVSALGSGAADYLVAFAEEVRRNPPATCQYRVITGQGEFLAARSREDNEFPLEPPPRGSRRPRA